MKLYFYLIELFALFFIAKAVNIKYTKNGVLREDGSCNINFVNFGIDWTIRSITVYRYDNTVYINFLRNGNEGLNKGDSFQNSEISKYVKITQGNNSITNFEVVNAYNGYFGLKIYGITTCEGLTVKQTYKNDLLVYTYLLYANKIPSPINTSFPLNQFGPSSNDKPYDKLYWNMNGGLDKLREECRIYISYGNRDGNGGYHFIWYVSTENINGEKCSNEKFYKIIREYFPKYDTMEELFGKNYEGYVLKRESAPAAHVDGIINSKYIIEVYQEACGVQDKDQVVCTISSDKELTFKEFSEQLTNNCLSIIINKNEVGKWNVNSSYIYGQFENYSIKVENIGIDNGSLPKTEDGKVQYKTFKAKISSGVARFQTSFVCKDGTYKDDKCRCKACPLGCSKCDKVNDNIKCLDCIDNKAKIKKDKCECAEGQYMNSEGKCIKCDEGCKKCNEKGCLECSEEGKLLKDGKCNICDKGYYEDPKTHKCQKCDAPCATCNSKGRCTTCLDSNAQFSDGVCVCKQSYLTVSGNCFVCDKSCKTCDENGCTSCVELLKKPVNGKC